MNRLYDSVQTVVLHLCLYLLEAFEMKFIAVYLPRSRSPLFRLNRPFGRRISTACIFGIAIKDRPRSSMGEAAASTSCFYEHAARPGAKPMQYVAVIRCVDNLRPVRQAGGPVLRCWR